MTSRSQRARARRSRSSSAPARPSWPRATRPTLPQHTSQAATSSSPSTGSASSLVNGRPTSSMPSRPTSRSSCACTGLRSRRSPNRPPPAPRRTLTPTHRCSAVPLVAMVSPLPTSPCRATCSGCPTVTCSSPTPVAAGCRSVRPMASYAACCAAGVATSSTTRLACASLPTARPSMWPIEATAACSYCGCPMASRWRAAATAPSRRRAKSSSTTLGVWRCTTGAYT